MGTLKIVAFKIGEEEYGLDIDHVQSIERINNITRVPNAPQNVKGVINLRGHVTPIIELKNILGLGATTLTDSTRVIITSSEDSKLGWIVDQTSDVMDVAPEFIESASASGFDSAFFEGIIKINGRLIILLRLEELMKKMNEQSKNLKHSNFI
jgi:purine-binding chemotaxis protein CheW